MSRYRFGVLVLFTAAIVAASDLLHRKPPSPLVRFGPCVQEVYGSTQRWYCSDGRAYDRYPDGHWQDAGPVTPGSGKPVRE